MNRPDDTGATAVEYALLVVLIAALIAGTVGIFGGLVVDLLESVPDF